MVWWPFGGGFCGRIVKRWFEQEGAAGMQKRKGLARLLYRLRYLFVMNIDNKVGHFQAHLEQLARLPDPAPYTVMQMDPDNPEHIQAWMAIIADAYGEVYPNPGVALAVMQKHLFLQVHETVFLCDGEKPIATVSIGTHREKPHVGGMCRLAVSTAYQGQSLGKYMRLLGYHKLYERGIRYGEEIISARRDKSIMMSFFCGFKPQHNMKYISYTGALENINFFQKLRIRWKINRLYREYERIWDQRFRSNYGGLDHPVQWGGKSNEDSGAGRGL